MIELALLGLLSEQNLHGYELKKQLGELLGPWSTVSFGSLYPALGRLERSGAVRVLDAHEAADVPADGPGTLPAEPTVPMTGALSGELAAFRRLGTKASRAAAGTEHAARPRGRRGKKVYAITAVGLERFSELLGAPSSDDDRSFALRVAFCRHLPADERLALFERRKADLTTQLRARRQSARRTDPYRRLLGERDTLALSHDLAWIDELIETTRADERSAPAPTIASRPPSPEAPSSAASASSASLAPVSPLSPPPGATPAPAVRHRVTPSPSLSEVRRPHVPNPSVKAGSDQ